MIKRLAAVPLLLIFLLMFAGCSSGNMLTGTWQDEENNIYQFSKDNILVIAGEGSDMAASGMYELIPDNDDEKSLTGKIKVTIIPVEGKETVTEATYIIEGDSSKVTITGTDGSVSVLTKAE